MVLTVVLRAVGAPEGTDETVRSDYTADSDEPGVPSGSPVVATQV